MVSSKPVWCLCYYSQRKGHVFVVASCLHPARPPKTHGCAPASLTAPSGSNCSTHCTGEWAAGGWPADLLSACQLSIRSRRACVRTEKQARGGSVPLAPWLGMPWAAGAHVAESRRDAIHAHAHASMHEDYAGTRTHARSRGFCTVAFALSLRAGNLCEQRPRRRGANPCPAAHFKALYRRDCSHPLLQALARGRHGGSS